MSSYCKSFVALLHGAVGWSAVCDCGISRLYALTFFTICDAISKVKRHIFAIYSRFSQLIYF